MWDERKGESGRRILGAEIKIEKATEGETFLNKSKLSHQNTLISQSAAGTLSPLALKPARTINK